MGHRIALVHRTTYTYDRPVLLGPQLIRLKPAPHCRTPILSFGIHCAPGTPFLHWQQDPYGNHLARLVAKDPLTSFSVEVRVVADLIPINPFDFFLDPEAASIPVTYPEDLAADLAPYRVPDPAGPRLEALVATIPRTHPRSVDFLVELNQVVRERIAYVVRMDPGVQTPEETLALARGSCRDSAWLLVQLARQLGLAARFASGYLVQLAPDPDLVGRRDGPTQDALDLHAWAEVYLPGAGWIGLDPTSGLLAGEGHLPLACTPRPSAAAPISGGFSAASLSPAGAADQVDATMAVTMTAERLDHSPRPTAPYARPAWERILAAGDAVDLALAPVRLTMGGEPTFIAGDEREAPEWTTAALGGRKRAYAEALVKRLRHRLAPGALLHYGQGKWYPGEPLPRWALGCYWRADGVPVWQDDALIADQAHAGKATLRDADHFVTALAAELGIAASHIRPAFEDAWYYLWREHRLPPGEDVLAARLQDPLERARLARVFTQGLSQPVGFALPLRPRLAPGSGWESGAWTVRTGHLLLLPGDSPMGFRLPLDALPWTNPADQAAHARTRDPFAPRPALGTRVQHPSSTPDPGASPTELVRTALCVEPRGGILHCFLPPIGLLEPFLDLIACIERVAGRLSQPVVLEGYHPPRDDRLLQLGVTPDPGVIEVNIHPQRAWRDAVALDALLYQEAAACGLVAERFLVDGRPCGTGGGGHLTLGGATAADSPFFRRPGLLRSLISYWHNHPALSYLFSGLFIGPTSQAPRADEARTETVYELETALAQLPEHGTCPPWLVDRVLRHLLVDLTGNTHRAEICIDKLYSPDSASGRLGLVELRGFEMPPHPEMLAVQQLLIRALVARFWHEPYRAPLARWGTDLHDRYMLPTVLWEDLRTVVAECAAQGLPLEEAWFEPHRDVRFPVLGAIEHRGVHLQLRQALEPWHVLGEEPGGGGTVRYVDSSVERLEVRLSGLGDDRHGITCNGVPLPLHRIGDVRVCGVRFRAWRPPTALHPTIGVHAPLAFEVIDRWNGQSVAGCTYHVAHPGGRAYEHQPATTGEAEARRAERFDAHAYRSGPRRWTALPLDDEYPFTLDLRRIAAPRAAASAS